MPESTVVMAKIGEAVRLNRRAILSQPTLLDNNCMGWIPDPERLTPEFLYFFSRTLRLDELSHATAVPSVRKSDVAEIEMPLPPIQEQRRIVEAIERLFAGIEEGERSLAGGIEAVEAFRASVLRAAFYGEPDERELTAARWETVQLGSVCEIRSGIGFPKRFQGRSAGDIPFAKVRDISTVVKAGGRNLDAADNYISNDEVAPLRGKPMPESTVVMAKIGEAVRLNRRAILSQPMLLDNNCMGWIPDLERLTPEFLYFFSRTLRLDELSHATAVPSVRKSVVAEIEMPLPPVDEQRRIVGALEAQMEATDRAEEVLRASEEEADFLKKAVLRKAFSGQLVPQYPEDEPASALNEQARREVEAVS